MKNIIYLLFFIISISGFAQSSNIANDELFLNYEKEYLKYLSSIDTHALKILDEAEGSFYSKFRDAKAHKSFKKSKDPLKWLNKNISKTHFANSVEAQNVFENLMALKNKLDYEGKASSELLDELVKKYDSALIWKTLKSRLPK